MKLYKLGFIGTGNIATAIINGIINSGYIKPKDIVVFDLNSEKTAAFNQLGCKVANSSSELTEQSEYVFLTIKPQIYSAVLEEIKGVANNTCFIDVAAGITISAVKRILGENAPVIRVMPNTPLLVGVGSTAMVKQSPVTDEQFSFIEGCFQSCGITATVNEDDINTVIAASGSSPAYIMRFANTLIEYAASKGITADDSKKLVVQTLAGCAKLMSESDKSISQLIADVTSPNGTTAAGLKSFDDNSFNDIVIKCLDETVKRAEELSK